MTPNAIPRQRNGWMTVLVLAAGLLLGTGAGFFIGRSTSDDAPEPLVQLPSTAERDWLRIVNSCPSPRDVAVYDGEDDGARLLTQATVPAVGVVTMVGIEAFRAQEDWTLAIKSDGGEIRVAFRSIRRHDDVVVIGALSCGSEVSG